MNCPPNCSNQKVKSAARKPSTPDSANCHVAGPEPPAEMVPYKKTTVSLPSRATAIMTRTSSPHQLELANCWLAPLSSSRFSVRPWRFIQYTICTTRPQAASAMIAWNHSCPSSDSQEEMPSNTNASASASASPAATPAHNQGKPLRPAALARNQVNRIPTTNNASTLSRQTIKTTCSIMGGCGLRLRQDN